MRKREIGGKGGRREGKEKGGGRREGKEKGGGRKSGGEEGRVEERKSAKEVEI